MNSHEKIIDSSALGFINEKLTDAKLKEVPVTAENFQDLTDIYFAGNGEATEISPPEIGKSMKVEDLLELIEMANFINGQDEHGQQVYDPLRDPEKGDFIKIQVSE